MTNHSPFKDAAAYTAGKYVPMSEARISVLDWGFTRSDAVYDVVQRAHQSGRHVTPVRPRGIETLLPAQPA
ncbi:MAG TPA: hypothetical protein VK104_00720 [Burkholderiaceae bacterium]|nr:hypothetical protein [Burkholderiaceae bacterium]